MKSDIHFRAALSDVDFNIGACRVVISVGDISVRSYPQEYLNILGDLQLNRRFLENRILTAFFFGDEPLLNLHYNEENVVMAYGGRKVGNGGKRLSGSFLVKDGLASLDEAINDLIANFNISDSDIQIVAQQIEHDLSLGVYNAFTKS